MPKQASPKPKYTRAFGNCERCPKMGCAIWFVAEWLLCRVCRDAYIAGPPFHKN